MACAVVLLAPQAVREARNETENYYVMGLKKHCVFADNSLEPALTFSADDGCSVRTGPNCS